MVQQSDLSQWLPMYFYFYRIFVTLQLVIVQVLEERKRAMQSILLRKVEEVRRNANWSETFQVVQKFGRSIKVLEAEK